MIFKEKCFFRIELTRVLDGHGQVPLVGLVSVLFWKIH